jgi:AcrR family transcriptional regulator
MTRGAIYGNFANRDDLFAAVALERWKPVKPVDAPGSSLTDHMRELGRCYYRAAQARNDVAVHAASFQLQTRKHPELAKRIARQARELVTQTAEELVSIYPASSLPMPAERLVRILGALGEGLMAEYFLDPDAYDEVLFVAAFEKFGG